MSINKYLRAKQICELTGLSRATIYAMEKVGSFPKKIALGARAVAWRESDIEKWIEERKCVVKSGKEAKPGGPRKARKQRLPKDASSVDFAATLWNRHKSCSFGCRRSS